MSGDKQSREGLILRVLWMAVLAIVWQVAELVLVAVVLLQLLLRLINGVPSRALMDFGDSLSQYLAQIGRFASFHSDEKPWPFADWPSPREPQGEDRLSPAPATAPSPVAAAAAESEPQPGETATAAEPAAASTGERATPVEAEPAAAPQVKDTAGTGEPASAEAQGQARSEEAVGSAESESPKEPKA